MFLPVSIFTLSYFSAGMAALKWIKTANWHLPSVHESLEQIGLMDPGFQFNFPRYLGIQKIFNDVLIWSTPFAGFLLSVILFFFCIGVTDLLEKNTIKKYH